MTALLVLSTVAAFASIAHGRSTGAPNDACPQVSPTAGGHLVGPQNTPSPYNITGLPSEYTPGETYTCKSRRGGSLVHPMQQASRGILNTGASRNVIWVTMYTVINVVFSECFITQ